MGVGLWSLVRGEERLGGHTLELAIPCTLLNTFYYFEDYEYMIS